MAKLPATIFVKHEKDGDLSYLVADANVTSLVEMGEKLKVGVYRLVETREITGVVSSRKLD